MSGRIAIFAVSAVLAVLAWSYVQGLRSDNAALRGEVQGKDLVISAQHATLQSLSRAGNATDSVMAGRDLWRDALNSASTDTAIAIQGAAHDALDTPLPLPVSDGLVGLHSQISDGLRAAAGAYGSPNGSVSASAHASSPSAQRAGNDAAAARTVGKGTVGLGR